MQQFINEIQMMQVHLTGVPYPDWELEQMSDRSIKDLHADLWARYDEDMADNRSMFFE